MDSKENPDTRTNDIQKSPEQKSAEYVDTLTDRAPSTEQSARENTGWTRRPDVSRADNDYTGVSDTIHAVPVSQRGRDHYDPTHRNKLDIQGEEIPASGDEKERRNEETHL